MSDPITPASAIPSLTPIPEDIGPNFSNLTILQTDLNSNAMSVPSAISTKGHLGLTQSAFDYRTSDPGVNFAPPTRVYQERRSQQHDLSK